MKEFIIILIKVFCVVSAIILIMSFGSIFGQNTIKTKFDKCLKVTNSYEQCYNIIVEDK